MLARELLSKWDDLKIFGIGGQKMKDAGVEVFAEYSSAIGIIEALAVYREVKKTFNKTVEVMERERPDVVVLIDYPDFNFRVGAKAKELGIKVFYYVSPQVWAWRKGRIHTMKEFIDMAAVLLPFEEKLYHDNGIPCEFVGHPIMEEMDNISKDKADARRVLGLEQERQVIALMPGSRPSELRSLLPMMLESVRKLKRDYPDLMFILSIAPNLNAKDFHDLIAPFKHDGVSITRENAVYIYTAADAAIVASGTAALQGALRDIPLIVIYKMNFITYWIAKMLIDLKYVNLANIILDKEAIPELIQQNATSDNIVKEILMLIDNPDRRAQMHDDLKSVKALFEGKKPTSRVAEMVAELADWQVSAA
jgi:lipid-A-disaccharide synthase